jgi:hypothetical protein
MIHISNVRFPRYLPAVLLVFVTSLCASGWAQGIVTGSITGMVIDPQGAVIQKAQISATQISTNATLVAVSEEDGSFSIRNVPVGTYRITIEASGFIPARLPSVGVDAGRGTSLGALTVNVGGSASVVTVSGSVAPLLDTDGPQTTATFDTKSIQNLPLSNGFDTATELIPGVVSTHADNFSNSNGDNFSVNGQRGRSNNFELDGQSNNDNSIAGPQVFFGNQDAIQELQVITNNFGAEYGRNAGAVVNYITKNGTNAFHGSGFDFYTGSFLSSLSNQQKNPLLGFCATGQTVDCNPVSKPRNVENRFGGTLGGPILKDKLWFFGSTFWDRLRNGASPSASTPNLTPTPLGLQQLAAAFPGSPAVAIVTQYGPYGIKTGNPAVIPGSTTTIDVNGVPIEFGGVQRTIANIFNDQEHLGRLDWQATSKDRLFARYFYQDDIFTAGSGDIASGQYVDIPATTHSIGADWSHTFSPNLIDQLRYSFQQAKVYFQGGAYPGCTAIDILNCPSFVGFIGNEPDQSFGVNPAFPQGRTVKVTQIQDNATWTHGNHTVLYGGEVDYQNSPNIFLPFYNAELAYPDFGSFVSDSNGLTHLSDGNPILAFSEVDAAGYVQDAWKIRPHFTVSIGVRWEYFGQAFNKLHDETVKRELNPATAFWDSSLPISARTVPSVNEFYKNFQPRVGFAWNPPVLSNHLVVRGGYAINSNPAFYNIFELTGISSPVANTGNVFCNGGNCQPANGSLNAADVRGVAIPQLPRGGDPRFRDQTEPPQNFRNPYVQTYTLGFQYQLGGAAVFSATYVGSHTAKEFQSVNQNPFLLPVAQSFPNVVSPGSLCQDVNAAGFGRPDCSFANLGYTSNGAWAIYNGIQANLTTRNYRGLTSTISYTYSRSVDNTSEVFSTGAGGNSNAFSENPLDANGPERGVSANSYPNALALAFNYDVPIYKNNNTMMGKLLGGFALNGIYRYTDGQPFTPTQPLTLAAGDTSYCDGTFNNSNVGVGIDTCRLILSNKRAPLNTVAYLVPPALAGSGLPNLGYCDYNSVSFDSDGNPSSCNPVDPTASHWIVNNQAEANVLGNPYPGSGRNILHGDSFNVLDASIFKTTEIREGVSLQLQLNAYNVLNREYRGAPLISIGNYIPGGSPNPFLSSAFNTTSSDYTGSGTPGNRIIQLGGKITF